MRQAMWLFVKKHCFNSDAYVPNIKPGVPLGSQELGMHIINEAVYVTFCQKNFLP